MPGGWRVSWEQLMVPRRPPSIDKGPTLEGPSLKPCSHCRAGAARDIRWRGTRNSRPGVQLEIPCPGLNPGHVFATCSRRATMVGAEKQHLHPEIATSPSRNRHVLIMKCGQSIVAADSRYLSHRDFLRPEQAASPNILIVGSLDATDHSICGDSLGRSGGAVQGSPR